MTFYRTCIYLCVVLIIFTLSINFVNALGVFSSYDASPTEESLTTENALEQISGLSGGMEYIWGLAIGLGAGATMFLVYLSKQISPLGIYLFSSIFWTSWLKMNTVININGVIPAELIMLFTVGAMFIFIAAIIGMLTGSG